MTSEEAFLKTLEELEFGGLLQSLSREQLKLVRAVQAYNKPGRLTLTLVYEPEGNGRMAIAAKVEAKPPKPDRGQTLFEMRPSGLLERDDARQEQIEFGIAETEAELDRVA